VSSEGTINHGSIPWKKDRPHTQVLGSEQAGIDAVVVAIGEKRRVFILRSYNYQRYANRERSIVD